MLGYYLKLLVVYNIFIPPIDAWDPPSPHQYHIQTDEGPERYFRYQTDSGQYRKEKRLQDGTVVGTYAWIDADGILRQRDYIADNSGYRIVKNKNVFVGRNIDVGAAVKSAKKFGTNDSRRVITPQYIQSSTPRPFSTTQSPSIQSYSTTTPSSLYISSTPSVVDVSNSISSTPFRIVIPTDIEITPNAHPYDIKVPQVPHTISTTVAPPIYEELNQNSIEYNPNIKQLENSYRFQNGPTYPLDKHGRPFLGGAAGESSKYDGVSVTNDGFRYYIPRAYHEEETRGERRSGSFGYIDPFGIRRVVYYNAEPGSGFQHRKNNRYVGFDATPYDPRP